MCTVFTALVVRCVDQVYSDYKQQSGTSTCGVDVESRAALMYWFRQAVGWLVRFVWRRTMQLTLALRIVRDAFVYPESGLIWCLRELVLALLTRSTGLVRAYGLSGLGSPIH